MAWCQPVNKFLLLKQMAHAVGFLLGEEEPVDDAAVDQLDNNSPESDDAPLKGVSCFYLKIQFAAIIL